MQKVITKHGWKTLQVSNREIVTIKVYAEAILKYLEVLEEEEGLDGIYTELMFSDAQAIADYCKIAAKRLNKKPRRNDCLSLVEEASETLDLT